MLSKQLSTLNANVLTIRLNWKAIGLHMISFQSNLEMLDWYQEIFHDELGIMNSICADLKAKENAIPKNFTGQGHCHLLLRSMLSRNYNN